MVAAEQMVQMAQMEQMGQGIKPVGCNCSSVQASVGCFSLHDEQIISFSLHSSLSHHCTALF